MAHNLETRNGKTSFAAVGQKAWHGLGTYVDQAMTAAQAIELGGINYTVEKRPLQVIGGLEVPNFKATVRTDTNDVLGVVTDNYTVVQNMEAFAFFDNIIEKGEAIFQTVGTLGKGEKIFVTAKLPKDIAVKGEQVENYLLLTTGHDGKTAVQAGFTSVRVVCNNTLTAALSQLQNKISIVHFKNAKEQIAAAADVMGIARFYTDELNQIFNKMAKVKINDTKLREYLEAVLKPRREIINKDTLQTEFSTAFTKKIDAIMDFAHNDPTQTSKEAKGTVWGAYNAVSGYYGHIKNYGSANDRMKDIMFSRGAVKIEKAFDYALALV